MGAKKASEIQKLQRRLERNANFIKKKKRSYPYILGVLIVLFFTSFNVLDKSLDTLGQDLFLLKVLVTFFIFTCLSYSIWIYTTIKSKQSRNKDLKVKMYNLMKLEN